MAQKCYFTVLQIKLTLLYLDKTLLQSFFFFALKLTLILPLIPHRMGQKCNFSILRIKLVILIENEAIVSRSRS